MFGGTDTISPMRDILLFVHLVVTVARLTRPGGLRSVVAESVLVRHHLLILNRGRKRTLNLCTADRILAGLLRALYPSRGAFRFGCCSEPPTLLRSGCVRPNAGASLARKGRTQSSLMPWSR